MRLALKHVLPRLPHGIGVLLDRDVGSGEVECSLCDLLEMELGSRDDSIR